MTTIERPAPNAFYGETSEARCRAATLWTPERGAEAYCGEPLTHCVEVDAVDVYRRAYRRASWHCAEHAERVLASRDAARLAYPPPIAGGAPAAGEAAHLGAGRDRIEAEAARLLDAEHEATGIEACECHRLAKPCSGDCLDAAIKARDALRAEVAALRCAECGDALGAHGGGEGSTGAWRCWDCYRAAEYGEPAKGGRA